MQHKSEIRQTLLTSGFSKLVSSHRLKKFQKLISKGCNDVIFIALGVDSRYNEGCKEAADFLLFNLFTHLTSEIESKEVPEELTEDVIIAIKEDSVSVYCNCLLRDYLLPYIAHWKNLSFFCLNEKELDQDAIEVYKIESFMSMVDGSKHVLIPYKTRNFFNKMNKEEEQFDKLLIEKWPIVQAYAVEGIGRGVFFTMDHNVSNIYEQAYNIFNDIDCAWFEKNILESLCLTQRHWFEMKSVFSSSKTSAFDVRQEKASEPLVSFFKHGQLSGDNANKIEGKKAAGSLTPFVKFGRYTSSQVVFDPAATLSDSGVTTSATDNANALHMTIQSISPHTELTCTRTHFFPPGTNASVNVNKNYKRLTSLYAVCAEACRFAITGYCRSGCAATTQDKAVAGMKLHLDGIPSATAMVVIEARDSNNRWRQPKQGKFYTSIKRVRVCIDNIPSFDDPQCSLGSVSYADTFIDSYIKMAANDIDSTNENRRADAADNASFGKTADGEYNYGFVVLTSSIGEHSEHVVTDEHVSESNEEEYDTLTCTNVYFCSKSSLVELKSSTSVDFIFNSDGDVKNIRIHATKSQPINIDLMQDVHSIVLCNNIDDDDDLEKRDAMRHKKFAALQLTLKEDSQLSAHPLIQFAALSDQLPAVTKQSLAIVFPAQSKALAEVESKVVPSLRSITSCSSSTAGLSFETGGNEAMMEALLERYRHFEKRRDWLMSNDARLTSMTRRSGRGVDSFSWLESGSSSRKTSFVTDALQPTLTDFISHLSISTCFAEQPMLKKNLDLLLDRKDVENRIDDLMLKNDKVGVSVVIGTPSSHVDELCASLVTVNRERVRWVVVRCQPLGNNPTLLDCHHLQKNLKETVAKRKSIRPGAATTKKLRIVVICNGYFDVEQVLSSIMLHGDEITRSTMSISAVISCVDPNASLIRPGLIFPQICSQSAVGLCNYIAFTGTRKTQVEQKNFHEMQSLLRTVNPDAAFILAEKGQAIRSNDFELLLNEHAFNEDAILRKRLLSFPQLYDERKLGVEEKHPGSNKQQEFLQQISITFHQPVYKGVFETRLRAINNMLFHNMKNSKVFVVRGTVAFTDGEGEEYDVTYATQSRSLTYNIREKKSEQLTPAPPSRNTNQIQSTTDDNSQPCYQLVFYGIGLDKNRLMDFLRKCGRQSPTKKSHKSRDGLTKRDLQKIQKLHETDPLPEGYYYNGHQYMSLLNDERTDYHPYFEKFVSEFLEKENIKVDEYNNKLKRKDWPDMFQPI